MGCRQWGREEGECCCIAVFVLPYFDPNAHDVLLQYIPEERRIVLVTEREVKGAVYQVGEGG